MADKLAGGIRAGTISLSLNFILRKTSDNTEQTGKVAADMTAYYWRQGESPVAISLSNLAAITSAWSSGGVKEADATNMPGLYRLDIPDVAFAAGAAWVAVSVKVALTYVYFERFNLYTHLLDSLLNEHTVTGSAGEALLAASEAQDIWDTMLPAGYYPGSAGYLVGTNLDAAVSSRLAPTVASRTLDVSVGGEAGLDWANIGSPTTTNNLSGTTIKTATDVETDTSDIQSRLPAVLISGRIDASIGAMAINTLTASALAADAVTEIQSAILTDATPFAGANIDVAISSRLATATYTAPPSAAVVADAVWDEQLSQHAQSGSAGEGLTAASEATDVWDTQLPAGYYPGTAGYLVGTNLDAQVSGALRPTVAGRTLDVSTGGEAGIDWNNIGSPTTTQNLSGTTVKTATDVETDTQDIQSRLPAALVSGRIDASVGAMDANTLTASALATDAVTEIQSGLATSAALATVQADTDDIQARLPAALVGGRMDSSVGAMATDTLTSTALAASAVTEIQSAILTDATPFPGARIDATISSRLASASYVVSPTAAENADAVWDEQLAQHLQSGSAGEGLIAASEAPDILDSPVPAGYYPGTLGYVIGTNLDATVSSRLATAGYTTPPTVGAIADQVWDETLTDHLTAGSTGNALNAAGSAGDPWATALPGAYGAGTAGKIVGDNINTTISSRLASAAYTTPPSAADNADAVWDEQVNQHQQTGSAGEAITAASEATDVWDVQLPAGYYPGSAGAILGGLTGGTAPTAAEVADAVWDESRSGHVSVGTFGEGVASVQGNITGSVASVVGAVGSVTGNVTGSIGSLATQAKADVNAEADTALADVGVTTTVTGRIDVAISTRLASASITLAAGAVTVGTNNDKTGYQLSATGVDDVWDEAQSGHISAGTFGRYLDAQVSAIPTSSAPSAATVADAVWDEVRTDHITGGTFGQGAASVQGNVTGSVASVTGNVGGNVAGSVASVTAGVTVTTNNDKTGYALTSAERDSIAAALLDLSNGIETSLTMRNALRLMSAALAGKLSGAATTSIIIRNAVADTKDRITSIVDSNGNRTNVTVDLS